MNEKNKYLDLVIDLCGTAIDQFRRDCGEDLRYETYRSAAAGGQHVSKIERKVRVTHIPSGITTESEYSRSQHFNRQHALLLLIIKLQQL